MTSWGARCGFLSPLAGASLWQPVRVARSPGGRFLCSFSRTEWTTGWSGGRTGVEGDPVSLARGIFYH